MAQSRRDIEAFISREAVEGCTVAGRLELPPAPGIRYVSFVDPSGGTYDSFTLAIAQTLQTSAKSTVVLDAVREIRPPFSPEAATSEFCAFLKTCGISKITGDRYAGEYSAEQLRKHGVAYVVSERTKSEIYRDVLPLLNSGSVELLDIPRQASQLLGLERRTGRNGKDSIDHAPNAHDDLINAAAGTLVGCGKPGSVVFFGSLNPSVPWLTIHDGQQIWSESGESTTASPQPALVPESKGSLRTSARGARECGRWQGA